MSRPRILDLFCGAGGAAMGYSRAGFDVVGVDIKPQPRYPFEFIQADAIDMLRQGVFRAGHYWLPDAGDFDAIHASPPCQFYSSTRFLPQAKRKDHVDLVGPTRAALKAARLPYVIENVIGAPLVDAVVLCGSSFGRPIRRHRLFESTVALLVPPCTHREYPRIYQSTSPDGRRKKRLTSWIGVYGGTHYAGEGKRRREAMGIDWMTLAELSQAIPPDYTELIGLQLIHSMKSVA